MSLCRLLPFYLVILISLLIGNNGYAGVSGAGVGGEAGAAIALQGEKFNRQLHQKEIEWIEKHAAAFAKKQGISLEKAKARLGQQALRQVDYLWGLYLDGTDEAAAAYLAATSSTFTDSNGRAQQLFTSKGDDYLRPDKYLLDREDQASSLAFYQKYIQSGISGTAVEGIKADSNRIKTDITRAVKDLSAEDVQKLLQSAAQMGEQVFTQVTASLSEAWDDPGKALDGLVDGVRDWAKNKGRSLRDGGRVSLGVGDSREKLRAYYGETATDVIQAQQAIYALNVLVTTAAAAGLTKVVSVIGKGAADSARAALAKLGSGGGVKGVTGGVAKNGTSVLGKYPDYIKLSDELGAKRFSIPTDVWNKMSKAEQWGANKKFLDRMIKRGDDIVLSNPVKNVKDVSGAYRKELDYLMGQGFKLSDDGARLIK